jgi:hypothetical protein
MQDREAGSLQFEAEERLPWLEPIEEMPEERGQIGKLIGLVLAGLVVIGAIVGGLWYWQQNAGGRGELIAAPEGPYKAPPEAEKARFDGDGTVAVAASEGIRPEGTVDPNRLPEQPIPPSVAAGRQPAPAAASKAAAPQPKAAARSVATAAPAAAAPAAAGGTSCAGVGQPEGPFRMARASEPDDRARDRQRPHRLSPAGGGRHSERGAQPVCALPRGGRELHRPALIPAAPLR